MIRRFSVLTCVLASIAIGCGGGASTSPASKPEVQPAYKDTKNKGMDYTKMPDGYPKPGQGATTGSGGSGSR